MRVVAHDHEWFVLEVEPGVGRVFDLPRQRLFAPMSLVAIMARGPWSEFAGDPEFVFDALSNAQEVPSDQLSLTGQVSQGWEHACGSVRDLATRARLDVERQPYTTAPVAAPHGWSSDLAHTIKRVFRSGATTVNACLHGSRPSSLR